MTTGTTAAPNAETSVKAAKADVAKTEAAVPAPAEAKEATTEEAIKDVLYIGQASLRTITAEEWLQVGLEHEPAEWNLANGFRLPAEDFSREALRYLVKTDGRFQLVDALPEESDEDDTE